MKTISYKVLWYFICLLAMCIIVDCVPKTALKQSESDTPEHHYLNGSSFLRKGDLDGAMAEFERAKSIGPEYTPAYVGIGLVQGEKGSFDQAFTTMDHAKDYIESDADKVLYHTGMIRLYTKSQHEDWLKKAQGHFKKAVGIDGMDPAPSYYMGLAYKKAGEFGNASDLFKKVIETNKGYREQADTEWEKVQNIIRAQPGTTIGKEIARLEKMTRADVAALFVEEMNLEKIFNQHNVTLKKGAETEGDSAPNDYHDHVLKSDIEKVNALGIKGLEIIGNRFDPYAVITRADFAIMCEDILAKVTNDTKLATSNIESPSPFKDVEESFYAKNAIMTCTTRGIMKADLNGYFRGDDSVSGAEALLTIRHLNDLLRY